MKKIISLLFLAVAIFFSCTCFYSCEKEDDNYYAGESGADFRPAVYTITSQWDFSKVSGLTSEQKTSLENSLNNSVYDSEEFETRADAVAAFDEVVMELKYDSTMGQYEGLKVKLYLKRGTAIIKSATLEW